MSRIVVASEFGGPGALTVEDVPVPEPGPGEVRVAVRAIGTNPADLKMLSGEFGDDPAVLRRLGNEVSGEIDAYGPGVEHLTVGDPVIVPRVPGPAYSDHVVVDADTVHPKPDSVSFEAGAGLVLTATTAAHLLEVTRVADGDTVLVHGASGGVGSATVQLARLRGARVVGTASERNHPYLRSLGAEPVSYGPGLGDRVRAMTPDGVDAALDLIGTDEALDVSVALVEDRTRVVTIAGFGHADAVGVQALGNGPLASARPEVIRLAGEGLLQVEVAKVYPLVQTAEAMRDLAGGHTRGKIIVVP